MLRRTAGTTARGRRPANCERHRDHGGTPQSISATRGLMPAKQARKPVRVVPRHITTCMMLRPRGTVHLGTHLARPKLKQRECRSGSGEGQSWPSLSKGAG